LFYSDGTNVTNIVSTTVMDLTEARDGTIWAAAGFDAVRGVG
jgi:hypothetical protein